VPSLENLDSRRFKINYILNQSIANLGNRFKKQKPEIDEDFPTLDANEQKEFAHMDFFYRRMKSKRDGSVGSSTHVQKKTINQTNVQKQNMNTINYMVR